MKTNKPYKTPVTSYHTAKQHLLNQPSRFTTEAEAHLTLNQSHQNLLQAWHNLRDLDCNLAEQQERYRYN